ncbi:hypothetical protein Leryth_011936 [Lithospermum erythrorhizon]|nr:hypothetical protein Leryth_011936 [Lithospermum erythrorhizon]
MDPNLNPTKLEYFDDMQKLRSSATLLFFFFQVEDGRKVMILESTIFHPQGGGQPSDTGVISNAKFRFIVQDVRLKDKIVFHYGFFEDFDDAALDLEHLKGDTASLCVDELRRKLNSRLHSAGHLLDICMRSIGLGHLEPTKGYHFPDGPFVEYRGTVPQNELEQKQRELELEANKLISSGGKVYVSVVPYDQACELCGGCLPDYIPKESTPRIVKMGENPGCPCGGTHVYDISEIGSVKVSQIRTKKGATKVFYVVGS